MVLHRTPRAFLIALLLLAAGPRPAPAALLDEIQVYVDDLNAPGEFSLQLHMNSTPQGPSHPVADPGGSLPNTASTRFTPEFAWGLGHGLEFGLYTPAVVENGGEPRAAAFKLRLKWVPAAAGRTEGTEAPPGTFWGMNAEYAMTRSRYDSNVRSLELRPIAGWRSEDWLFAANPCLELAFVGDAANRQPVFAPNFKVARTVARGLQAGIEYYGDTGPVQHFDPWSNQQHALYVAFDLDRKPWNVNFGIGRGLTGASDRWTVKAIFEIPVGG